jgi:hypothetical protein
LELLFAHGDDGTPILRGAADPRSAAGQARPVARHDEAFLADITAGASDLRRQGWAVVVADTDDGARLAAAITPLVRARCEDQGDEVVTIRVPPGLTDEAALAWKKDVYPAAYGDDEARRPRYLLILGDLDRVSLETQHALASDGLPGRLACTTDDGYAAYADKVLAWQRAPAAPPRAVFYTVHDGSDATAAGHAKLIEPCRERCARNARTFAAAIERSGAAMPDPSDLLAVAAARQPSVMLSMSHGLGPPRRRPWTRDEARRQQGAMSFGAAGAIAADDVARAAFLPGGVWLYFACFGAGTPHASAYRHWLELLARSGMPDVASADAVIRGLDAGGGFVSGLAQAALANPDGPLAMIGHVDLAWSYSYEELRVGPAQRVTGSNRALNFYQVMSKLVAGERAGAAMLALRLVIDAVGAELTAHYDRQQAGVAGDPLALGNLWMLHQDLRDFTLLGDPAVRLAIARADEAARPVPPAVAPAAIDPLERAVLAIAGGDSPGVHAAALGVPRSELVEVLEAYRAAGRAALAAWLDRSSRQGRR